MDEEEAIKYYFSRKYDYISILKFLDKFHNIKMSKRTLQSRLKGYGLSRRNNEVAEAVIREHILKEIDGAGSLLGYRAIWRNLHLKYGVNVSRSTVQGLLREIDPEGSKLRRAHRLKRRNYLNPGPNHCWHTDGYDKLKPYGFPIHACIDGFSRRLIWLKVTKSNNDPEITAKFFMESIAEVGGCPTILRTDRGTENGIMATAQAFLRRNHDDSLAGIKAHRFGSSHSNQRIEAWWAYLRRSWSSWWIDFFKDMISKGDLDASDTIQIECLWFCFNKIVQIELDQVMEAWNNHYVRKSRHHTASGVPNTLFLLPETVGTIDHMHQYDVSDLEEIENELGQSDADDSNESMLYHEYFTYVTEMLGLVAPKNWRDGLVMYDRLLAVAQ